MSGPGPYHSSDSSQLARKLAEQGSVMTLATCSMKGASAPVYYLFEDRKFYFFSNPDSRHITDVECANGLSMAASIFSTGKTVKQIKGLQMGGWVETVYDPVESFKVVTAYIRKFKIQVDDDNPLKVLMDRFHARLYRFDPEMMVYMDNAISFGFKVKVTL